MPDDVAIESVLNEQRLFPPPAGFADAIGGAHVGSMQQYREMYDRSIRDPDGFWGEVAGELDWFAPWTTVLEWEPPDAKWFIGGTTNLCHNCVDRQVANGHGDQVAIIWEGEPLDGGAAEIRRLTYSDLARETARFANVLKAQGVIPLLPELRRHVRDLEQRLQKLEGVAQAPPRKARARKK